jgi:replicative DNA helicase
LEESDCFRRDDPGGQDFLSISAYESRNDSNGNLHYLTLISSGQFYSGNSHLQVTEISKALKTMAKEFDCPVICLAQLNRSVESRNDKRPMMSDIRESGSVEQDADVIMFLYRDVYYDKNSENHFLEIIVSKNRNGPVGTVKVNYSGDTGTIEDQ